MVVSVTSGTIFLSLMIATALAESSFARSTIWRARWISRISTVFSAVVIAHPLFTIEPMFHPLALIGPGFLLLSQILVIPALRLADIRARRGKWRSPRYQALLEPSDWEAEESIQQVHKNIVKRIIMERTRVGKLNEAQRRIWDRVPVWQKKHYGRELAADRARVAARTRALERQQASEKKRRAQAAQRVQQKQPAIQRIRLASNRKRNGR